MVGCFIAATIVSLVQFLRVRDKRMLPLAAMFAFQAQALGREWYDIWRDVFQVGVCAAGLALMLMLSRRPSHETAPRAAGAALAPEPAAPVVLPKD